MAILTQYKEFVLAMAEHPIEYVSTKYYILPFLLVV